MNTKTLSTEAALAVVTIGTARSVIVLLRDSGRDNMADILEGYIDTAVQIARERSEQ